MNQGGVLDYLVGGWSTSATWTAQTGIPFTVTSWRRFRSRANGFNQTMQLRLAIHSRAAVPRLRQTSI